MINDTIFHYNPVSCSRDKPFFGIGFAQIMSVVLLQVKISLISM